MEGAAHTDTELTSSMMQEISLLEQKVKKQAQEIQLKDRRIAELELKIKALQGGEDAPDSSTLEELQVRCLHLQSQVSEMERFLSDYGLIWVGETQDKLEDAELLKDEEELLPRSLWKPGEAVVSKHEIDFDLILENVKYLNLLAGEGISQIEHTLQGARLRQPKPLPLTLYKNGIIMCNGAFRPYQDPSTQQCLQDIMDGYFPSELQPRYPNGVPLQKWQKAKAIVAGRKPQRTRIWGFEVHLTCKQEQPEAGPTHCHKETRAQLQGQDKVTDRRDVVFQEGDLSGSFPGHGQMVGHSESNQVQETTEIPGPKPSSEQFPKGISKVGVQGSAGAAQQGSDGVQSSKETPVETPRLADLERCRVEPAEEAGAAGPGVCTLRVKSESGEHTHVLKMLFTDTIGDLRQHLAHIRGGDSDSYEIISTFPQRVYTDNSRSLQECGLIPNVSLLLRRRDPSQQEGLGCKHTNSSSPQALQGEEAASHH